MEPRPEMTTANPRHSLRALRLEQIQIWGAAAHARSCAFDVPVSERRSSLFESDFSADADRARARTARHSLVRLGGDDDVPPMNSDDDSDVDDEIPRRPRVLRVGSINSIDGEGDSTTASSGFVHQRPHQSHATTVVRLHAGDGGRDRGTAFPARAKSAVRPDEAPLKESSDLQPRARSFFDERRPTENSRSPFARARASIRLLGRYSRTRSAKFPLFRGRNSGAGGEHDQR